MSEPFVRKTFFVSIANVFNATGSFLCSIIVARTLGPEGTGVVALVTWVAMITVGCTNLGLSKSLERYLPELQATGQVKQARRLATLLFRITLCVIVVTVCGFALVWWWARLRGVPFGASAIEAHPILDPVIWSLLTFLFVIYALGQFFESFMLGMQRFRPLALIATISAPAQLTAVTVGALTIGVTGALGGYLMGPLILAIMAFRLIGGSAGVSGVLKERVRRFAPPTWLSGMIAGILWSRVEIIFLDNFWGIESVGLFAAGHSFSNLASFIPIFVMGAVLPYLSEKAGQGDRERMQSAYWSMAILLALLVFPVCFGIAAIAPVLVPLTFGQAFAPAVVPTMILMGAASIGAFSMLNMKLIYSLERGQYLLISSGAGIAAIVVAGLIVVPVYGVVGAACLRLGVQSLVVALELWFVIVRLGFRPPFYVLSRIVLAAALCGAVAFVVLHAMEGVASLAVAIPCGAAVYVLAIRLLRVFEALDEEMLDRAVHNAPGFLRGPLDLALLLLSGRRAAALDA